MKSLQLQLYLCMKYLLLKYGWMESIYPYIKKKIHLERWYFSPLWKLWYWTNISFKINSEQLQNMHPSTCILLRTPTIANSPLYQYSTDFGLHFSFFVWASIPPVCDFYRDSATLSLVTLPPSIKCSLLSVMSLLYCGPPVAEWAPHYSPDLLFIP